MDSTQMSQVVELRASYRYVKEHPWVVQAMTGFLSAYFMEKPEFRVQQHFVELESGMHVWVCEIPPNMKVLALLKRLQASENRSEEHTSELQSRLHLVCRLLLEKKNCLPHTRHS